MAGKNCPTCGASPSAQKRRIIGVRDISQWEYVANMNPVDGVECPSCHFCFRVEGLDVDSDGMLLSDDTEFECVPVFCPMCGEKLGDAE